MGVKKGTVPNLTALTEVVTGCANGTKVEPKKVMDCFDTDVFHNVMKDTAKQTVHHTQTPWVMITNVTGIPMIFTGDIKDSNFLLRKVCDAWQFNGGSLEIVKGCDAISNNEILM